MAVPLAIQTDATSAIPSFEVPASRPPELRSQEEPGTRDTDLYRASEGPPHDFVPPRPPASIPPAVVVSLSPQPDPVTTTRPFLARKAPDVANVLGDCEVRALEERREESDQARAEEIRAAALTDRRLSEERIAAIWADLQTEVFRIWEEVLLRRQKVMNELFDKWCKVMMD